MDGTGLKFLKTMKPTRVVLATLAVIAFTIVTFSSASAQQYKRHALVEEGTGTWCGYCPYGAYALDSLEKWMGDNVVEISFHGPTGCGEPLDIAALDTLERYDT